MKINFPLPTDKKRHRYCQNCLSEKVKDIKVKEKTLYQCEDRGKSYDRLIDIDPALTWWVDEKTKEYWHESIGVFIINSDGGILLIERVIFPYGFTIPAGHLEAGEKPLTAATRELEEETGINADNLTLFSEEGVPNDRCRRGADYHKWHLYTYLLTNSQSIIPNRQEGKNPIWLTLEESLKQNFTYPTRFFLEKYGNKLINSALPNLSGRTGN